MFLREPYDLAGYLSKATAWAECLLQELEDESSSGGWLASRMQRATLHLMVGLPCSGKTTLARVLEQQHSALRLTPDEWQVRLFGQDAEDPLHDARHSLIEALQWEVAERALTLGTSVILDFGFWAREEREGYRLRAKQLGARSEVHFLDVSTDELLRRLAQRNLQPGLAFRIPEERMKPWIELFEKPSPDDLEPRPNHAAGDGGTDREWLAPGPWAWGEVRGAPPCGVSRRPAPDTGGRCPPG